MSFGGAHRQEEQGEVRKKRGEFEKESSRRIKRTSVWDATKLRIGIGSIPSERDAGIPAYTLLGITCCCCSWRRRGGGPAEWKCRAKVFVPLHKTLLRYSRIIWPRPISHHSSHPYIHLFDILTFNICNGD